MSAVDEELLNQALQAPPLDGFLVQQQHAEQSHPSIAPSAPAALEFTEWACEPNGSFRPTCAAVSSIPPAAYAVRNDDRGVYFQRLTLSTDSLIVLDDTASQRVVSGVRKFWNSRERYLTYEVLYKRGVLLWGPAGSGKTGTVMLLCQELIDMGGMVVLVSNPSLASHGLSVLRKIEPQRPLIAVFEDIDELIREYGEHSILALLDGEFQIPNVVNIATTNYPERLGPRIINRPSRFDERIFIDTPNAMARERYLRHITKKEPVNDATIARWVKDSSGFSIAHLRELVIACQCLGHDYTEVLMRLKAMHKRVPALDDYMGPKGFSAPSTAGQESAGTMGGN